MAKKTHKSRVKKIEPIHYARRAFRKEHAKVSIWAQTESGDLVWLCTESCYFDNRRIETKIKAYEEKYSFMIGKEIGYILKPCGFEHRGFLHPYGTTPDDYKK